VTDILHEELISFVFPISGNDHVVQHILWARIGIKLFGCQLGLLVLFDILGDLDFSFVVDERKWGLVDVLCDNIGHY
jgi:hypothetical protein